MTSLGHSPECPGRYTDPCTCGGGLPVMTPGAVGAGITQPEVTVDGGTVTVQKPGWYQMTVGAQSTADAPKDTDDHPYRDVERSRDLAARAEEAALEGKDDLAHFLLQLAGEARLLAELQGRWEY